MTLADIRGVFEHSPWVAERAWQRGPFRSAGELHAAMMATVREATRAEQLALIRAHPELAGAEAAAGRMTQESTGEQRRLGFMSLSREEFVRMQELNRAYREKFGFPCIVALRLHATRESVMAEMARRLANEAETEITAALEQIGHIARGRLDKLA
jgi:OHCU decarboxylase